MSVYSPHTAFDSAPLGINQHLAAGLQLFDVRVLVPKPSLPQIAEPGAGRFRALAAELSLGELAERTKAFLQIEQVQIVGPAQRPIRQVAVACGSAGEFLTPRTSGCECLVTGEVRFHTCLEAERPV